MNDRALPLPRTGALTKAGEEILRAVAPVVLGPLLPADGAMRARALEDAMWVVDDYLAHLSLPLQREASVTLALLHSLPARALLLRTRRAWRDASPERAAVLYPDSPRSGEWCDE